VVTAKPKEPILNALRAQPWVVPMEGLSSIIKKNVTVHSIKNRIFSVILCFCVFVAKVFMPLKHKITTKGL